MSVETHHQDPQPEVPLPEDDEGGPDTPQEPTAHNLDALPLAAPLEVSPEPPPASEPAETKSENMLQIPSHAMAKIKQAEREKGAAQAAEKYEARMGKLLKLFGVSSWEELEQADPESLRQAFQGQSRPQEGSRTEEPGTVPASEDIMSKEPTPEVEHPRKLRQVERENERLLEKQRQLNRARAHEERKRKAAERALAAKDAENELRVAAARSGITDVDYALHHLKRKMSSSPVEGDFDAEKYFTEDLRKELPYLYKTESRPANTGVDGSAVARSTGGNGDPVPSDPKRAGEGEDGKPIDARTMSDAEYKALLRKRGIRDPSVGVPG